MVKEHRSIRKVAGKPTRPLPGLAGPSGNKSAMVKDTMMERPIILTIDPGHGGEDPGVQSNKIIEKNRVLQLATSARFSLQKDDPTARVFLTRDTDWHPSFKMRASTAKSFHSDFAISVHINGSTNVNAAGLWLFYKHGCSISRGTCEALAANPPDYFRSAPVRVWDSYDDPKTTGDEWLARPEHVLEQYPMPAVLIEYGFATNERDAGYLAGRNVLVDFGAAVATLLRSFRTLSGLH